MIHETICQQVFLGSREGPLLPGEVLGLTIHCALFPVSLCCSHTATLCGCHPLLLTPRFFSSSSLLPLITSFLLLVCFVCFETDFFSMQPRLVSVIRSTCLKTPLEHVQLTGVCCRASYIAVFTGAQVLLCLGVLVLTFRGHLDSFFSRPLTESHLQFPFVTLAAFTGIRGCNVDSLRKCCLSTTVGRKYHLKVWLMQNNRQNPLI